MWGGWEEGGCSKGSNESPVGAREVEELLRVELLHLLPIVHQKGGLGVVRHKVLLGAANRNLQARTTSCVLYNLSRRFVEPR